MDAATEAASPEQSTEVDPARGIGASLPGRIAIAPEMIDAAPALERRGRSWLIWSFLLCPCHLPLSLAVLASVLAGTSLGVVVRDHAWAAGTIVTIAWVVGTGYGLHLIRRAEREGGACRATPLGSGTRRPRP